MDREGNSTSGPTMSSISTSGSTSASTASSGRTSRERTPHGQPQPHQSQHHQPNRPSGRQPRHPIHRESQHYPMAERCMCSSCHLSARLFPRTEDGRIMLPIVPGVRSPSAHAYGPTTHGYGGGGCVGENGDLMQYMLASNEGHLGEFVIGFRVFGNGYSELGWR